MSGPSPNPAFWDSYRTISNRLKKKFMRKPNYQEAAQGFEALYKAATEHGGYQHAALCAMGVVRCEQALGGSSAGKWVLQAGRDFVKTQDNMNHAFYSSWREYIPDAVNCYYAAADIYVQEKRFTYAGCILLELAECLSAMDMHTNAATVAEKAASTARKNITLTTTALEMAYESYQRVGKYEVALELCSQAIQKLKITKLNDEVSVGIHEAVLSDIGEQGEEFNEEELVRRVKLRQRARGAIVNLMISRYLLTLLLNPNAIMDRGLENPASKYVLSDLDGLAMSEDVKNLLECFADAIADRDWSGIYHVQQELSLRLPDLQADLCLRIASQFCLPHETNLLLVEDD
eukprot:Clim_evm47s109 gene=Clim_evmTU47s109